MEYFYYFINGGGVLIKGRVLGGGRDRLGGYLL